MSSEMGLKESQKKVGQLYPVIVAKDGRVVDGLHRLKEVPNWKSIRLEEIDTDEKYWAGRIVANTRRDVSYSERKDWFNQLAEVYFEQGIKSDGSIVKKVMEATGYSDRSVARYLDDKYKMKEHAVKKPFEDIMSSKPLTPIDVAKQTLGADYNAVEEAIRKEVQVNIEADMKEKLSKDPDFIIEIVENAPMTLPSILEKRPYTKEGYYKPFLTKKQAEELSEAHRKTEEDLQRRRDDPNLQARARLTKAWMSIGHVLGVLDNLFCPKCGSDAKTHLVWKCHPEIGMVETQNLYKSKLEH